MSAKDAKRVAALAAARQKSKTNLTEDQIDQVLRPEQDPDQFQIGSRIFRLRVLAWRWEREFRKYALPLFEHELKPIEEAITKIATKQFLIQPDLNLRHSLVGSELAVDQLLTLAVVIICLSQDPLILDYAATGRDLTLEKQKVLERQYIDLIEMGEVPDGHSPADYYRRIVCRQMDKQKMVQTLGEFWKARLFRVADLAGIRGDIDSLMQRSTHRVKSFLAVDGKTATTSDKSTGSSTDATSGTTSPNPTAIPKQEAAAANRPKQEAPHPVI